MFLTTALSVYVINKCMHLWLSIACGICSEMTSFGGTVSSRGYPGDYSNNEDCVFKITVKPGRQVLLAFRVFSVERGYDFVQVNEINLRREIYCQIHSIKMFNSLSMNLLSVFYSKITYYTRKLFNS